MQAFVVGIESIAEPIECAEERAGLVPVPTAAVFGERTDTQWTRVEKPQVFLLRKLLRQVASAGRGEQVRQQQFAFAGGLESQVEAVHVFERLVTVGQEQVSGEVCVILSHGARGGVTAHVRKTGILV